MPPVPGSPRRIRRLPAALVTAAVVLVGQLPAAAAAPSHHVTGGFGHQHAASARAVHPRHPGTRYVRPEAFGAVGDGVTDDTAALQKAFDHAGRRTVLLSAGHVYAHSQVLLLRKPGLRVQGGGTLLATDEATSSVWIAANNVRVTGVHIRTATTTTRWSAWEQMGVRIDGHRGDVLRHVHVAGSAAAGIYVGGAAHFLLDHVTVSHTRADGIHITGGANHGRVVDAVTHATGDDGIAVVSYRQDGTPCRYIRIVSPTVAGTTWGRGLSVVGGDHITETNIDVSRSDAAAVYIAAEGAPWFTTAPHHVTVTGGRITHANVDPQVDHGAVLVMSGEQRLHPTQISVSQLRIRSTRRTASRDFGVVTYGRAPSAVRFAHFRITGGPESACSGNAPASSYRAVDIVQNGTALPDHR